MCRRREGMCAYTHVSRRDVIQCYLSFENTTNIRWFAPGEPRIQVVYRQRWPSNRGDTQSLGRQWAQGRERGDWRSMGTRTYDIFHFVLYSRTDARTESSNKIFTSARNGELIMWDISRAGSAKLGLPRCFGLCIC